MKNTMDGILVRYDGFEGNVLEEEENEELHYKECSLLEFLKIPAQELSSFDLKVQQALKKIYELNNKKPPLYKQFSEANGKLVIDCTTGGDVANNASATYDGRKRCIEFKNFDDDRSEEEFIGILAHELKHAEHDTPELRLALEKANDYQWQQLSFLDEAQAYAVGAILKYELFPASQDKLVLYYKKQLEAGKRPLVAELNLLRGIMNWLVQSDYKILYDKVHPIQKDDTGIGPDIPSSLMSDALMCDLFWSAEEYSVPKGATTPASQLVYLWNDKKYDDAIAVMEGHPDLFQEEIGGKMVACIKDNNSVVLSKLLKAVNRSNMPEMDKKWQVKLAWMRFVRGSGMAEHQKPIEQMKSALILSAFVRYGQKNGGVSQDDIKDLLKNQQKLNNNVLVDKIQKEMNNDESTVEIPKKDKSVKRVLQNKKKICIRKRLSRGKESHE